MNPRIYRIYFPREAGSIRCPVGDCEGQAKTHTNPRIHFVHYHIRDTIVITEEGNRLHPRCPACEMFVPWAALNRYHPLLDLCVWGEERNRWRLSEEEAWAGVLMALQDYDRALETVS